MHEPIDVMLPFFGDVDQFRSAVTSVLDQSTTEFRLVCVDDCFPSDAPRVWLESLGDPRIEYVRNEENLGVAKNFNRCLALVRSDWFVMMGGDDIMLPNYLATVSRLADESPRVDIIQPGVQVIDDADRLTLPMADRVKSWLRPSLSNGTAALTGERLAESLTRADWAYFPSLLWRTESARHHGFNERFDIALDLALMLDIALDGGTMVVADELSFQYRRHAASASSVTAVEGLRFWQERDLFLHYAERFEAAGWTRAARIARRHTISRLNAAATAFVAVVGGRSREARNLAGYVFS